MYDVEKLSRLGAAAMFKFLNETFPEGLLVSQVFKRNTQGQPSLYASVFGPLTGSDGKIRRNGGIAVFANVRELATGMKNGEKRRYRPEHRLYYGGVTQLR